MTHPLALLPAALLFTGIICWLGVALLDARTAKALAESLRIDAERDACFWQNLTQRWRETACAWQTLAHLEQVRADKAEGDRRDAHRCLELVLSDHDVATTLDMVNVVPLRGALR